MIFPNKTFTVNANWGVCFTRADGKPLRPSELSSGEQRALPLFYEPLFNAPPESLVLIDSPETSLHIVWQLEFIRGLKKIAEMKPLSFVVATHSPDIINENEFIDLYELTHVMGKTMPRLAQENKRHRDCAGLKHLETKAVFNKSLF
jgi:predicted ATP-binding protein involved in virulence